MRRAVITLALLVLTAGPARAYDVKFFGGKPVRWGNPTVLLYHDPATISTYFSLVRNCRMRSADRESVRTRPA